MGEYAEDSRSNSVEKTLETHTILFACALALVECRVVNALIFDHNQVRRNFMSIAVEV